MQKRRGDLQYKRTAESMFPSVLSAVFCEGGLLCAARPDRNRLEANAIPVSDSSPRPVAGKRLEKLAIAPNPGGMARVEDRVVAIPHPLLPAHINRPSPATRPEIRMDGARQPLEALCCSWHFGHPRNHDPRRTYTETCVALAGSMTTEADRVQIEGIERKRTRSGCLKKIGELPRAAMGTSRATPSVAFP